LGRLDALEMIVRRELRLIRFVLRMDMHLHLQLTTTHRTVPHALLVMVWRLAAMPVLAWWELDR